MRLYTPYSLSRGAPSATRSSLRKPLLCLNLDRIPGHEGAKSKNRTLATQHASCCSWQLPNPAFTKPQIQARVHSAQPTLNPPAYGCGGHVCWLPQSVCAARPAERYLVPVQTHSPAIDATDSPVVKTATPATERDQADCRQHPYPVGPMPATVDWPRHNVALSDPMPQSSTEKPAPSEASAHDAAGCA